MKKTMLFSACMWVCVLVFLIAFFGDASGIAFADSIDPPISIDAVFESNTNTDTPNGVNIQAYANELDSMRTPSLTSQFVSTIVAGMYFCNNCEHNLSTNEATVNGDDNIVNIVPKSLFMTTNEVFYVGKEYGVYVKTTVDSGIAYSTVFLLDVVTETQGDYVVDVRLNVLFGLDYTFVTSNDTNRYLFKNNEWSASSCSFTYTLVGCDGVVVPMLKYNSSAAGYYRFSFHETVRYKLANISFAGQLVNQNAPNEFDEDYGLYTDNGYFFIGNDYFYSATKKQGGDVISGVTQILSTAFNAGLDIVSALCEPIGVVFDVAQTVVGLASGISTICNQVEYRETNGRYGYGYTTQYLPNTRASQIQTYGRLVRATHILPNTSGGNTLYFNAGDYAEAHFMISHTDSTIEAPMQAYSRLFLNVGVSIVDENESEERPYLISTNYWHDINTGDEKDVNFGQSMDAYILPHGQQAFSFTPQIENLSFGGKYYLDVASDDVEVYVNNQLQTKVDGVVSFSLASGTTRSIVLKNTGNTLYRSTPMIDVGGFTTGMSTQIMPHVSLLCKYTPQRNGLSILEVSNADIAGVYEYNANNQIELCQTLGTNYVPGADATIIANTNKAYYVVLYNPATRPLRVYLSISEVTSSYTVGTMHNLTFGGTSKYEFRKFTGPQLIGNYLFMYSNAQDFNFIVLNEDGQLCNYASAPTGYLRINGVVRGKTYYIGIQSDTQQTIEDVIIQRSTSPTYTWKIYDGDVQCTPATDGRYALPRGKTYRVELWVNNVYAFRNIRISAGQVQGNNVSIATLVQSTGALTINMDSNHQATFALSAYEIRDGELYSFAQQEIEVVFNPSEVEFNDFNYVNAMEFSVVTSDNVTGIKYLISGHNASGVVINYNVNAFTNEYIKDCMTALYQYNFVGDATITITAVKIRNHDDDVIINKIQNFNCSKSNDDSASVHINNALHLYNLRYLSNTSASIYMDNDINYNLSTYWEPIAELNNNFYGGFKVITGIQISIPVGAENTATNFGLFRVNNATISAVGLRATIIDTPPSQVGTWVCIGSIAGINNGTVTGCTVSGWVESNRYNSSLGGLVGKNYGTISLSAFSAFGEGDNIVRNHLYANGNTGGIAGESIGGQISYCTVTSTDIYYYVVQQARSFGGIVGYCDTCTLSYNSVANVTMQTDNTSAIPRSIHPRMGLHVGNMVNSTVTAWGSTNGNTYSYNYVHNRSQEYCFANCNGYVGQKTNSTTP